MKKKDFIIKDIGMTSGAAESAKIYTITTIHTGETEVVVEKTITEKMKIQDYEKAVDLYERLTCGAGRKVVKLESLAHTFNPNK